MSVNSKMTAIADEIRAKTGKTNTLTLDQMAKSIPEVYAAGQKAMVDELKLLPTTVSGSYISLDDVSELPHKVECKVESINLLRNKSETATLNGLTFTVNNDKSITVTGTATEETVYAIGRQWLWTKGIYPGNFTISGTPSGYDGQLCIQVNWADVDSETELAKDTGDSASFEIPEPIIISTSIVVKSGTALTDVTFYPMLNYGTGALPYTPYAAPESVKVIKHGADESEGYQALTPDANGIVEGMTSTSPYMNIHSDTEGVNIEVEYYKSPSTQTYYDAFWDAYQDYGDRHMYAYAFSGTGWNERTFNPKYVIKPGSGNFAYGLFALFNYGNPNLDFRNYAHLLDLSNVTIGTYMFQDARFDFIDLDLSKFTSLQSAFSEGWSAGKKTTITLKVSEKCTSFNSCFSYCTALTNLIFREGSVIAATLNLQHSPLTRESIESIVIALSSTVTGQTVTFKKSAKEAAFTDDEWAALIATKPNWTFALL